MSELNQDLRAAKAFLFDQTNFTKEANEQRARLKSVEIYKSESPRPEQCPICDSSLPTPTPAIKEINKSLRKVEQQLETVHRESPHLQAHVVEIEQQIGKATESLKEVQRELRRAISEDENAKAAQNQLVARARYLGKLSNFVEVTQPDEGANAVSYTHLTLPTICSV